MTIKTKTRITNRIHDLGIVMLLIIFVSFEEQKQTKDQTALREYIFTEERLIDFDDVTTPKLVVSVISQDSIDTAWVSPAKSSARSSGSWKFSYVVKKDSFIVGGKILLRTPFAFLAFSKSWTYPQVSNSSDVGFVSGATSNPATEFSLSIGQNRPFYYAIRMTFTNSPPAVGDTITIIYGDTLLSPNGRTWSNVHARKYEFSILTDKKGSGSFSKIIPVPTIQIAAREAKHFLITVPSISQSGDILTVKITALDQYNNRDTNYAGSLTISCVDAADCGIGTTAIFEENDSGRVTLDFAPSAGRYQLVAVDSAGSDFISNPFLVEDSLPEYRLYWGDIQNHTNISDGNGSVESFYDYARLVANLDFVSMTDHDHTYGKFYLSAEIWEIIRNAARDYNNAGNFVAFLGWEWTNERRGHKHIIYPTDIGEPYGFINHPLPTDLWRALEGQRALTIPHHIAWGSRKVDWTYRNDEFQPLVEIYSQHGANEFLLNPLDHQYSGGRTPGHYVRDALAMGHKLGILASSDDHFGYPGNGWMWAPTALDSTARGTGLTGVYANDLSRESVFAAIKARRVFGTTDHRTIVDFKVNDAWMGSEISSDSLPKLTGQVESHTLIKNLEIVKYDGKEYSSIPLISGTNVTSYDFTLRDSSFNRSSFYYLRVTSEGNVNDRFAWSSPVWVEKPLAAECINASLLVDTIFEYSPDSSNVTELGLCFESTQNAFSQSAELSFEAFDITTAGELSIFLNGIYLADANITAGMSWGIQQNIVLPRYLVDSLNTIRFEYTHSDSPATSDEWGLRNVFVSGAKYPSLVVIPSDTLDFGFVEVGNSDTLFLQIENISAAPLQISEILITDSIYTVLDIPIEIGIKQSSETWIVSSPVVRTLSETVLKIISNDPFNSNFEIVIITNSQPIGIDEEKLPISFNLSINYPNPFNPVTNIEYSLPNLSNVSLIIYNLQGQVVTQLVDGEIPAGVHTVTWDASNFASGIYFYRLTTDEFAQTRKMVLLK
ncbi:T9SS type A sorting domain-containing protein [Candidatus Marinimicrobia bacterium MT.SAG.3]|nr:T9SS type A sorting domain-containing protein [Candidatus Marinimicrobia bacterium MT.SAG.3]